MIAERTQGMFIMVHGQQISMRPACPHWNILGRREGDRTEVLESFNVDKFCSRCYKAIASGLEVPMTHWQD